MIKLELTLAEDNRAITIYLGSDNFFIEEVTDGSGGNSIVVDTANPKVGLPTFESGWRVQETRQTIITLIDNAIQSQQRGPVLGNGIPDLPLSADGKSLTDLAGYNLSEIQTASFIVMANNSSTSADRLSRITETVRDYTYNITDSQGNIVGTETRTGLDTI